MRSFDHEEPGRWRGVLFAFLFLAAFVSLVGRAAQTQLEGAEFYKKRVVGQLVRAGDAVPYRGEILDRNYDTLATSIDVDNAIAEPFRIRDKEAFADSAGQILGLDPEYVYKRIRGDRMYSMLKRDISRRERDRVRKIIADKDLPGLALESAADTRRFYPHKTRAGQVLGYVGKNQRGAAGLEQRLDEALRGETQHYFRARGRKDFKGRILPERLDSIVPEASSVALTIDSDLQDALEQIMAEEVLVNRAEGGMALVTDVVTGEILAMVNVPFLNPNSYGTHEPWVSRNRIVTDMLEPGSTMKPITYAIALDLGLTRPNEVFELPRKLACKPKAIKDLHYEKRQTSEEVIQNSSNMGTALMAWRIDEKTFYERLRRFGLGSRTGIDFPAETRGLLADPTQRRWGDFVKASISFGHGVSTSVLQLHYALSSLANGGKLMKPRLIRETIDHQGMIRSRFEPEVVAETVRPETAEKVLDAMERVVSAKGTGKLAQLDFYRVVGKTGTAQIPSPKGGYMKGKWNTLFYGAFPRWAPQYAITVVIEKPEVRIWGGDVAAPTFKRLAEAVIAKNKFYIVAAESARDRLDKMIASAKPAPADLLSDPDFQPAEGLVPDFRGRNLRETLRLAQRMNVVIEPVGEGIAVQQSVPPFTDVPERTLVVVDFERTF